MKYLQTFDAGAFAVLLPDAPPPVNSVNPNGDNDRGCRCGGERNSTVHNCPIFLLQAFDVCLILKRQLNFLKMKISKSYICL